MFDRAVVAVPKSLRAESINARHDAGLHAIRAAGLMMTACFASSAFAEEGNAGLYIGAAIGRAEHTTSLALMPPGAPLMTGEASARNTSWNAALGYRVNSSLAFELGYRDLGDVRASLTDPTGATNAQSQLSLTTEGFSLAMIGRFPFGKWTPYIRAGVLFSETDLRYSGSVSGTSFGQRVKDSSEGAFFGTGLTYNFSPRWAIQADFTHLMNVSDPGKGLSDFHDLSIGIVWKF